MKMAKIIASVVALLLALSWLATLAQAAAKFVVGYAAMNSRMAPLWLAEEQDYFVKYGMEPQAVFLRSATILVTGLGSGDIHVGSGGPIKSPPRKVMTTCCAASRRNPFHRWMDCAMRSAS
jgi:ABC-type nitrate/sulfonate/bicarbonate transport system substrate-binding protein